jgi:hypothetical protein
MNPEENDEIEMASDAQDDMGDVHQDPPVSIIDLVIGGQASGAKDAIYASLYQKVGEKIDALRPEIRAAVNPPQNEGSAEDETPTEE